MNTRAITAPRIGQQVVCVNDVPPRGGLYDENLPKLGEVYTVRAIVPCARRGGFDEDGLLLVEITNLPGCYDSPRGLVWGEMAFRISRFRPLRREEMVELRERARELEPA